MKQLGIILTLTLAILSCTGQEIPNKDFQLETAVLAAPEKKRENATILGFDADGKMVTLREGTNEFICIADDPNKEGFSVAAYHNSLEPFMARGRALKAAGLNPQEVFDKREEEVAAGTLEMPDKATLYVTTGTYNEETKDVEDIYTRYVIYIPYATEETTGMPLSPEAPGAPWIMNPGTHRAHIMINPPKK